MRALLVAGFLLLACTSADPMAQIKLDAAVKLDDAAGIDTALKAGADLNKKGGGLETPLMAAVLGGKAKAVDALLKHDPDVTIGEEQGYTPMHGAGFQVYRNLEPYSLGLQQKRFAFECMQCEMEPGKSLR